MIPIYLGIKYLGGYVTLYPRQMSGKYVKWVFAIAFLLNERESRYHFFDQDVYPEDFLQLLTPKIWKDVMDITKKYDEVLDYVKEPKHRSKMQ